LKNAVFISSGIGNALLLAPLVKELKKLGPVAAFSTSPFQAHQIFEGYEDQLFDQIYALDSARGMLRNTGVLKRRFQRIYMDHFAAGRKNILFAHANGKEILTTTVPDRLPQLFQRRLKHIAPRVEDHEVTRYMRFIDPDFTNEKLSDALFQMTAKPSDGITQRAYITLQPGSGNNNTPWKSLALKNWVPVVEHILEHYPDLDIVLLGDHHEEALAAALPDHPHVVNAIGKTALQALPGILSEAQLHIGNDSGLMHIAGSLGVPTVTVWGGSDPNFYGWHSISPELHTILYTQPSCGPCSRWLKPNLSRVELPSLCPDFKCLKGITSNQIISAIDNRLGK
jgi:ADP-heptose:LPS heptosyltransferase